MRNNQIKHPYFYPKTINKDYEILTLEEVGFIHADGRTIAPTFVTQRDGTTYMLGTSGSRIYMSSDNGVNWTRILDAGLIIGNVTLALMTNHPDINKSIVAISADNTVYRSKNLSDSAHTAWDLVLSPPASGLFTNRYGWSLHGRVLILATYGNKNASNPPRHLYLSRDWGGNFEQIETVPLANMADPAHFHLHDVEYDPYSSRIWLATGDQSNSNVWYSDNWGASFKNVYEHGSRTTQPTGIHALPDRVIFTSDDQPNGIKVWYRDKSELKAAVKPEDIKLIFTPDTFISEPNLRNVANLPQTEFANLISEYPYNILLPFSATSNTEKTARILATPNGEDYFEVFRSDHADKTIANASFTSLLPVMPNDAEGLVYALMYKAETGSFIVRFKTPEWVRVG